MEYYDDNFGSWHDTDDPDVREFYRDVQRRSVEKECQRCGCMVKILPHYAYCDSCANEIESGRETVK